MTEQPTFQSYERAGYAGELLPIAPPGSKLSPNSEIDPTQVGKIPMQLGPNGWAGCIDWANASYDSRATAKFQGDGAGIGVQGRSFPAVDIDVRREDIAAAVEKLALDMLGDAPVRVGQAPKRLLVYRGDIGPRWLSFSHPDDLPPARGQKAKRHLIEVLGRKKHWVAEGIHPRTLKPYTWTAKRRAADKLVEISEAKLDLLFDEVERLLTSMGATDIRRSGQGGSKQRAARPPEELLAPEPGVELVREALRFVANHGDHELDYDPWFAMIARIKGSTGGSAEGLELAHSWSSGELTAGCAGANGKYEADVTERTWHDLEQPRVGWPELLTSVEIEGGAEGAEFVAQFLTEYKAALSTLCRRYVYREPTREWIRAADARVVKLEAFNDTRDGQWLAHLSLADRHKAWSQQEDPKGEKPKWISAHDLLKGAAPAVQDMTYMPAKPKLVRTPTGLLFNVYDAPKRPFQNRVSADEEIAPFHELMEWVFPAPAERMFMYDYMSSIAQYPGRKIHFAPVLFSVEQGVGKDTVLKVLRYGVVGESNMASIAPSRLDGEFNADWAPKQVVLVTELPSHQKRDLYNKVKDYVASGAGSLSVNPKNQPRYEVPNNQCWVFTTNKPDALALEKHDRRFAVLQAREARMPASLRDRVNKFFDWDPDTQTGSQRGLQLAGEWLRQRTVSTSFNPYECSLVTAAKEEMRKNARTPLEEVLEDAWEAREGPFGADLLLLQDALEWLPPEATPRGRPTARRVADVLTNAIGCRSLGRPYLGRVPAGCRPPANFNPRQMSMFSVANHERYAQLPAPELAAEFWVQQQRVQADELLSEFFPSQDPAAGVTPIGRQKHTAELRGAPEPDTQQHQA